MKDDDAFERFVREVEPGLRRALTGHLQREQVPDALAEAFACAWQHRERVMQMDNPSGYLDRVAQSRSRTRRQGWLEWPGEHELPDVEPGLTSALLSIGGMPSPEFDARKAGLDAITASVRRLD